MNGKQATVTTISGFLAALIAIVTPVYIISSNGVERHRDCVESGGSYLRVPNTEGNYECVMGGAR